MSRKNDHLLPFQSLVRSNERDIPCRCRVFACGGRRRGGGGGVRALAGLSGLSWMIVLAAPQGFEPRYADPESAVLPLNEGATVAKLSPRAWPAGLDRRLRQRKTQPVHHKEDSEPGSNRLNTPDHVLPFILLTSESFSCSANLSSLAPGLLTAKNRPPMT